MSLACSIAKCIHSLAYRRVIAWSAAGRETTELPGKGLAGDSCTSAAGWLAPPAQAPGVILLVAQVPLFFSGFRFNKFLHVSYIPHFTVVISIF